MKKNEIFNHYKANFSKDLSNDKLLDWENKDAQFARFNVLKQLISKDRMNGFRLLDVGCGTADLFDYLTDNNINCDYTGVDILPQMINVAQLQHPELNLICKDIFKDNNFKTKYDVVYSSGIFNIDLKNNYSFLSDAIVRFMSLSNNVIIFNLLSDTSLDKENGYFYFNQNQVQKILNCLNVKNFQIITGYLHNDMSVIIKLKN